jgi:glycine/D-amino acid oxidase-like deaminating enzyme
MTNTTMKPTFELPDSLWKATAEPLDVFDCQQHDIDTDLLIIGAGYTGLSTALHAIGAVGDDDNNDETIIGKSTQSGPIKDIVVIDQAQPGWGCSGRNGGQIIPHWKAPVNQLKKLYPGQQFDPFIRMQDQSAKLVFGLIEQFKIDCHSINTGNLIATRGKKGYQYLRDWVDFQKNYGADVELLDAKATADMIGSNAYDACLYDHRGGSIQPLSYAQGLAQACLQQGVQIFKNTQAVSITADGKDAKKGWLVKTDKGTIKCNRLVIGTNGYTDKLWPGLAQTIVPVASMIAATKPLPEEIASKILPSRRPVAEYAGIPAYYRIDESNRLVFGSRGNLLGNIGSTGSGELVGMLDTRHLKKQAIKLFPSLASVDWEYDWAGYVAITTPMRPLLTKLGNNAFAGLGYNGRGITTATSMGRQLARALKGQSTSVPIEAPKPIPFHRCYPIGVASRVLSGHIRDYFTARMS